MTGKINDGGPAYPARPTEHLSSGVTLTAHPGMTKREAYAQTAMAGILAGYCSNPSMGDLIPAVIAAEAVLAADALIAALGSAAANDKQNRGMT